MPAVEHDSGEHERQKERPHQVELLLDRERPVVLDGRGWQPLREVVDALAGEVDVCGEEDGPDAVEHSLFGSSEVQEVYSSQIGDDQRECGGRKDPLGAPSVELSQRDVAAFRGTREEQPGDEEAGQHEEYVDTDEAAPQEPYPGVPEHDEEDGNSAKALNVVSMSERLTDFAAVPRVRVLRSSGDGERRPGRKCGRRN